MQPANNSTDRNCHSCGKPVKGRSDKKFCDDYCRNNYNNQLKGSDSLLIRNINNALKKNRHLLAALLPEGENTVKTTQDKLLSQGFSFKYFTHQYITKKGSIYHYCYDLGYLHLENNWMLIVADKDI